MRRSPGSDARTVARPGGAVKAAPGSSFPSLSAGAEAVLLDLDRGAGLFELGLDRVGLVLGDALLDRLRRRVDEVLRLFEAEPGEGADDLDHLDLLAAGGREDDVERRLLLGRARAVAAARGRARGDRNRSGGGDAPLLLDLVLQLDELEHCHTAQAI